MLSLSIPQYHADGFTFPGCWTLVFSIPPEHPFLLDPPEKICSDALNIIVALAEEFNSGNTFN
jgi:hypothetical protein